MKTVNNFSELPGVGGEGAMSVWNMPHLPVSGADVVVDLRVERYAEEGITDQPTKERLYTLRLRHETCNDCKHIQWTDSILEGEYEYICRAGFREEKRRASWAGYLGSICPLFEKKQD